MSVKESEIAADDEMSASYMQLACEEGYGPTMLIYAVMCSTGVGVVADEREGMRAVVPPGRHPVRAQGQ